MFLLFGLLVPPAWAEERPEDIAARIVDQVGERQVERWLMAPDWPVDDIIEIAYGYAPSQALTAEAIDYYVQHQRAKARARAMEDLLIADLDADLTVTGAEIGAIALALSGHARGLLWTRQRRADLDADGRVDLAELRLFADRRAMRYLSEGRALALGNLMALDLDGDGQVAVAEAERALVLLNRAVRAAQAAGYRPEDA